jgi:hypothetical protein
VFACRCGVRSGVRPLWTPVGRVAGLSRGLRRASVRCAGSTDSATRWLGLQGGSESLSVWGRRGRLVERRPLGALVCDWFRSALRQAGALRRARVRPAGRGCASQSEGALRRGSLPFAGSACASQGPGALRRVDRLCEVGLAGARAWPGGDRPGARASSAPPSDGPTVTSRRGLRSCARPWAPRPRRGPRVLRRRRVRGLHRALLRGNSGRGHCFRARAVRPVAPARSGPGAGASR